MDTQMRKAQDSLSGHYTDALDYKQSEPLNGTVG